MKVRIVECAVKSTPQLYDLQYRKWYHLKWKLLFSDWRLDVLHKVRHEIYQKL